MAIQWGSYTSIGYGASLRVGLDLSVTYPGGTLTTDDSAATLHWKFYAQLDGTQASGNDDWFTSGDLTASGTKSWSIGSDGGTTLLASGTKSVPLVYNSGQTLSIAARLVDAAGSTADPVVTNAKIFIPGRPVEAPAKPTNVVAARYQDSDTNIRITWTNNATTSAPYDSITITRALNGGTFSAIANIADGTATSFIDATAKPGNRYTYVVQAVNSAGKAATSSNTVSTTPVKPGTPAARKGSAGSIIVTRPSILSPSATHWEVKEVGGATLATDIPVSALSWTHSSPSPSKAWAYVIRAVSTGPVLYSDYSEPSNTVQVIAPPLAPTDLAPNVADATLPIELTWDHNPVDTTPQRKYEIEHRLGTGTWTSLGVVTSATEARTLAANTWSNGETREWRVYTWGEHVDRSPPSAGELIVLNARPVAGILTPDVSHDSQRLTVEWSYHDDDNHAQAAWKLRLLQGSQVLEAWEGLGQQTSYLLPVSLENNATYTLELEVQDGSGLWSDVATELFTVTYAPPAEPVMEARWYPSEGYVSLTLNTPPPLAGQRPLAYARIERVIEDRWVTIADNLPGDGVAIDMTPPSGSLVAYRTVAVSDIGSETVSPLVAVETETEWVFINYGPGFGSVARVWGNLDAGRGYKPAKFLKRYAGRTKPMVRMGLEEEETYTLTATLFAPWADPADDTSSWDRVREAVKEDVVCFRDPEGTRLFVTITGTDLSNALDVHRPVTLPMTVVDHDEEIS